VLKFVFKSFTVFLIMPFNVYNCIVFPISFNLLYFQQGIYNVCFSFVSHVGLSLIPTT
jgi:hypothetical protein